MEKIGIITYHNVVNYGAILQTFALQKVLEEIGYEVEIIDYENDYFRQKYINNFTILHANSFQLKIKNLLRYLLIPKVSYLRRKQRQNLIKFTIDNLNLSSIKYTRNTIDTSNKHYDIFITGSDQVWNLKLSGNDSTYFLDFVKSKKKISYAASFGNSSMSAQLEKLIFNHISDFNSVLVREKSGKKILNNYNIESNVVVDPTLLLNSKDWQDQFGEMKMSEDYIFVYLVAPQTNLIDAAIRYANELNLKIIVFGRTKIKYKNTKHIYDATIEEYLSYINHAKAVFTTSYHGVLFSINLNKEFYYELNKNISNNNDRIIDIVNNLQLKKQEITNSNNVFNRIIDWDFINNEVAKLRNISINLLIKGLSSE